MGENRHRHTVWMDDAVWDQVESHYQEDNCSTKNEYIEKAIQFYSGYLDAERADGYLPRVLSDILDGKLGALGKRVGHLLFKLAVDLVTLRKRRVRCVKEVRETNGEIDMDDALAYQKGVEEWRG